jgi:glutathione S-transferase
MLESHSSCNESDPQKKADKEKEMFDYIMPKYLGRFNTLVKCNGGKYLVGDGPSYADFWMAHFLQMMTERFPSVGDDYPELFKAGKAILDIPQIKLWIEKRPKDDSV